MTTLGAEEDGGDNDGDLGYVDMLVTVERVRQLYLAMPLLRKAGIPACDIQRAFIAPQPTRSTETFVCTLLAHHCAPGNTTTDSPVTINTFLDLLSVDDLLRETSAPWEDPDVAPFVGPRMLYWIKRFAEDLDCRLDLRKRPNTLAGWLLSHKCSSDCFCSVDKIRPSTTGGLLFSATTTWPHFHSLDSVLDGVIPPWYARFESSTGTSLLAHYISARTNNTYLTTEVQIGMRTAPSSVCDVTAVLMARGIRSRYFDTVLGGLYWISQLGRCVVRRKASTDDRLYASRLPPPPPLFFDWLIYHILERVDCVRVVNTMMLHDEGDESIHTHVGSLVCDFVRHMCRTQRSGCVEMFVMNLLGSLPHGNLMLARATPVVPTMEVVGRCNGRLQFLRNCTVSTSFVFRLCHDLLQVRDECALWKTVVEFLLGVMSPADFLSQHGDYLLNTIFGLVCESGDLQAVEACYALVKDLLTEDMVAPTLESWPHFDEIDGVDNGGGVLAFLCYAAIAARFNPSPAVCCFLVGEAKRQWPKETSQVMERLVQIAGVDEVKEMLKGMQTMAKSVNVL